MIRTVCVTSGGGDSITNGLMMLKEGHEVHFLHIPHGQKSELGESLACKTIVQKLKEMGYSCELHIIEIPWLGQLGGSGLTDKDIDVPEGLVGTYGSTIENIFTPGRNAVLLGIAAALAERIRAEYITFGCNQSEVGYKDNTKDFLDSFTKVLEYACYHIHPKVISPEWEMDKVEIYRWSFDNKFGWAHAKYTWSCDSGPVETIGKSLGEVTSRSDIVPCGKCGCCRNRRLIFYILNQLYSNSGYMDEQKYVDADWFYNTFLPTIKERGIPQNKWFSKYAGVLGCSVIPAFI